MAQFRGTVQGNRSEASRLGHKTTGLTTTCNAWDVGVRCEAVHVDGGDIIRVYATGGSNNGAGSLVAVVKGPDALQIEVAPALKMTEADRVKASGRY